MSAGFATTRETYVRGMTADALDRFDHHLRAVRSLHADGTVSSATAVEAFGVTCMVVAEQIAALEAFALADHVKGQMS